MIYRESKIRVVQSAIILGCIVFMSAAQAKNVFGSPFFFETLNVGQSKTVTVHAGDRDTITHIFVQKDKTYKFTVGSPAWNNGPIETTAAGYADSSPLAALVRHRNYNTMALVGEIWSVDDSPSSYTNTSFLIGMGRTWTASRSGFFVAIANDCPTILCYADNSRVVTLTIKRTA
jgi:hypothetical protein